MDQYRFSVSLKPSGAETRTLEENGVNTMAADALAPCGARTSAAMTLIMQDC